MHRVILASLLALLFAGTAAADPLRSDYLKSDETLFYLAAWPDFGIVSTLPDRPPEADLRRLANEAVCFFADHPAVVAGLVPFGGPLVVRFWALTEAQAALGPQVLGLVEPWAVLELDAVICGEPA